ncbi:DNA polymerase [Clostridium perfringens]|uniref:DNA polymerase n=1 Tax=Clostridium perfringens TaxID=1502 RepID=UPI0018E47AA0|nr:DNA polymerase [Clostridium perfringens]MBI5994023.1 DNA polymerase [Clostridium perfringens]MBI5999909.1 DNA polymerase [Clostridium perfringens]MDK0567942.1 DNA polymerase [Clostridium perfringens]
MESLSIDLETYSDIDLKKCGVYKYAESPNFEILLFAYSVDNGPVQVIDLAQGEDIPTEILAALTDDTITKWAYNASFERICLSVWLRRNHPEYFHSYSILEDTVGDYLDPSAWKCSRIWGAYMGLPLSLEGVGAVLKLSDQKMKEGKDLIKYFCVPCKATKVNGGRTRNLPSDAPDKWDVFKSYNKRDVEVELAIKEKLSKFPVPEFIWYEYHLDQEINDRGIGVDMQLVENAIDIDSKTKDYLMSRLVTLTGLENPNSVQQMKTWLSDYGIETESLDKKAVKELLSDADKKVSEVLECRQQLAKSSVKKYTAMQNMACDDNRARGCFMFYGANRSGRWAGRGIQLQNLPQNHMSDLEEARNLVRDGNFEALELLYDNVPGVLSELIRTAFVPKPGYKYIVADFSAIEARVLSFLAGEQWRIDVFKEGKDIYCASASQMFKVPVEKHGVNSHLRQKGKIAELALGYGGSVGALTSMGAIEMGLAKEELQPLVNAWRDSNQNITNLWWSVDSAVKQAVIYKSAAETHGLKFYYKSGMLFIDLPSGRKLCYVKPRMGVNQFGSNSVTYEGINNNKWTRIESYGPKFVENIVQAISRDILAYAMRTLSHCFICGHVHDELIIECSKDVSLEAICEQMGRTPPWIKGLLLRADGYECDFYKKD